MDISRAMQGTPVGDTDTYVELWLAYQQKFMEILPVIPLYSNVYFDFFTERLTGYEIENHASWGEAIVYAQLQKVEN